MAMWSHRNLFGAAWDYYYEKNRPGQTSHRLTHHEFETMQGQIMEAMDKLDFEERKPPSQRDGSRFRALLASVLRRMADRANRP